MFIYSAKMDKKKLAAILIGAAVLITALVLIFTGDGGEPQANEAERRMELLREARLSTTGDMLGLLTSLGWEVEAEPADSREVTIPEEFSAVYERYNELQLEQGFDLSEYKGEIVQRYVFKVVNHSAEEDVRATLLIRENRLIGGDICSAKLDGFMHTLISATQDDGSPTAGVGTDEFREVNLDDENIYPTD